MKTQAMLPVGVKGKKEIKTIKAGDILELLTGEKVTFIEMKRTKFIGKINGKTFNVPVYHDRQNTIPYIVKIVGTDKTAIVKKTPISKLKVNDLFSLEGSKETFMYIGTERKRTKTVVKGLDVASGKVYSIAMDMNFIKIDLNKVKREVKEKALI